ncbi:MAG: hypothetical protein E6J88_12140 [Deltaproteobacteria bacterium]|nr:MAG: hypothetical protein E6J88_12140 [Deltaproteobacteria bacterium]
MRNFGVLSAATFSLALACGGSKGVKPGGGGDETPTWVAQGTGAFNVESGKKLQGVGVAPRSDPRKRRQAADAAAAQQLQGGIDALAAGLSKMTESTKENVGDEIAAIVRKAAAAVPHVHDHYVAEGSESALDQVDVGALKQAVQGVDGDDNLKREIANNLDRAFDQLAPKQ